MLWDIYIYNVQVEKRKKTSNTPGIYSEKLVSFIWIHIMLHSLNPQIRALHHFNSEYKFYIKVHNFKISKLL